MAIVAGSFPKHLDATAKTGFLEGLKRRAWPWQQVASQISLTAAEQQLVDLGAAPMPVESISNMQVQSWVEKQKLVAPKEWEITVGLTYKAMRDDQTGDLRRKCASAGDNFQKHINKLVFQYLNGGDSTTYGLCYDGQEFFDSDHVDAGADYQTNQDNEFANAFSLDNFETALVAARGFLDDRGEPTDYMYDTIVVPPALEREAGQIVSNPQEYGSGNRNINIWQGQYKMIVSPHLDSTAYIILACNEPIRPMLVAMREEPHLLSTWEDYSTAEGYTKYWKFYGSYNVFYGDWRLAVMGNT